MSATASQARNWVRSSVARRVRCEILNDPIWTASSKGLNKMENEKKEYVRNGDNEKTTSLVTSKTTSKGNVRSCCLEVDPM